MMQRFTTAFAVLAVGLTSACARGPVANSESAPQVPIVRAAIGTIAVTVPAVGRVGSAAGTQTKLSFATAGRIASIDVRVGDRVNAGDTLAELDSAPLALAAQAANADAQGAGIDRSSTRLAVDNAALARAGRLYAAGVVARKDVEAAQAQLAADRADAQIARAGAAGAYARAELAQRDLANATLRSPIAGIVTVVYQLPGESADPSVAVVAVTPQSPDQVTLQVFGGDAVRVASGDIVRLRVGAAAFEGTVSGVSGAVDPSTQNAQVIVRATIPAVLSGAALDAQIVVAHDRGIVLPKSAIVADPSTGKTLVFVQTKKPDGTLAFDERDVRVLFANDRDAEVSGVRAGEAIAASGAFELLPPAGGSD